MKVRSACVAVLLAVAGVAAPLAAPPAATAAPPPETGEAIITNQDAGPTNCTVNPTSAYNQHVVVVDPLSGAFKSSLGKPANVDGVLNDAKPYDRNNKIVAIWGRIDATRKGGVGVYDRATGLWSGFALPDNFSGGDGAAHSVTVLPDGRIAVAQTGQIANTGWGWIAIFNASGGTPVRTLQLRGIHGIEWDGLRNQVFAIGDDHVKRYTYDGAANPPTLTERELWTLPGVKGGHELRRRRVGDDYFVTTNDQAWVFDPEVAGSGAFRLLTKSSGTGLGGGVKSVDERFDGIVEYGYWKTPTFFFLDRPSKSANFCMKGYKVRWLYARGDPVFEEEGAAPPPPPEPTEPADAEPFQWEKSIVRGNGVYTNVGGQIWAGGAAGDTKESAAKKIRDRIASGATPYVKFYHWGDSGSPKMSGVQNATDSQLQTWRDFASSMGTAIGGNEAYVIIEPEWDSNPTGACTDRYIRTLKDVIGIFRTKAPNAVLINSVGLWKSDSEYRCFKDKGAAALFDSHGFLQHLVSNSGDCPNRHPDHPDYPEPFGGGTSLETAKQKVRDMGTRKIDRLKTLFGGDTVMLTDMAVTRCGWGDEGQRQIFATLVDLLTKFYAEHGLRGVAFRSGAPAPHERYLGDKNEGMFDYGTRPAYNEITRGKTVMNDYLTSIGGPAERPTFTSAVTGPASVAPGGTAALQVTVTNTKGSLSNGIVDLEIDDAAGNRVTQNFWTGQNFANGQTVTKSYTWTAPVTPGTYTAKVGVFSSTWADQYHWNNAAKTITVGTGQPAFTSTATATPSSVGPGGATTITASVTNSGGALSNGVVTLEVRSADGLLVGSRSYEGQNVASGGTATYSWPWTAPSTAGTYSIAVVVTGAGGSPEYHRNGSAGSLTVSSARFTSTASPSRTVVVPGGATTIGVTVTNTGTDLVDGIVDVEVYDVDGIRVGQTWWTGQNIAAGASASYSWPWTVPATSGSYQVKVGVFASGWSRTLHWNGRAASITVMPAEFETAAGATPAKVVPGGTSTITATVTATGGALDNAIVDLEVYNSAGTRVSQQSWSGQTLVNNDTRTYTWNWTAPATTGTYTVKIGVFGAGWSPTYDWNDNADQVVVANPSFTSGADVSASTVAPGGTVTITSTFTNTGGEMLAGNVDLEIYNSSGTRVTQKTWNGEAIRTGETRSYAYTWTAPTTTGTYTVKLGVMDTDWSPTWHWNNAAATISVGSTFQPSFRVGDGANTWWIEVYTSSDVTAVDVIVDDGDHYVSLTKKSWGAWAATSPEELDSNDLVRFIARRSSDGATAGSNNFFWLAASPTTDPGWACTFTVGSGASTSWVEVAVSSAATSVEVKVNNGAFTALTYSSSSGKWGKAMTVPVGANVVFRATRSDGARSYSQFYKWLQ